jgi:hypothetical protein
MAAQQTAAPDCTCGANIVNLEEVTVTLRCAQCGQFHSALVVDVDGLVLTAKWLEEARFYADTTDGKTVSVARVAKPELATRPGPGHPGTPPAAAWRTGRGGRPGSHGSAHAGPAGDGTPRRPAATAAAPAAGP